MLSLPSYLVEIYLQIQYFNAMPLEAVNVILFCYIKS